MGISAKVEEGVGFVGEFGVLDGDGVVVARKLVRASVRAEADVVTVLTEAVSLEGLGSFGLSLLWYREE